MTGTASDQVTPHGVLPKKSLMKKKKKRRKKREKMISRMGRIRRTTQSMMKTRKMIKTT